MEKGTVRTAQTSHRRARSDTAAQECTSAVMGIVQHLPLSVMVWMTVEMALMKRIATCHVLIWNSSASPMAVVCLVPGSATAMLTAKIAVTRHRRCAVRFQTLGFISAYRSS